jgi:two-component system CheB/CheR fusion protein
MDSTLQKKVLPLFHYTLNPGGFLFLGTSETIGDFTDRFSAIDTKWKIFKRKDAVVDMGIKRPLCLPPSTYAKWLKEQSCKITLLPVY